MIGKRDLGPEGQMHTNTHLLIKLLGLLLVLKLEREAASQTQTHTAWTKVRCNSISGIL